MKKGFGVFLSVLWTSTAFAENLGVSQENYFDDEIPIGPVALCSVENSLGLHWKDGKWQRANYNLSNYIIQKVDHRKHLETDVPSNTVCFYDLGDDRQDDTKFKSDYKGFNPNGAGDLRRLNRCYTIKAQGDPFAEKMLFADSCNERMDMKTKQVTVRCGSGPDRFAFQPSGEFLRYFTPTINFSQTEYRDSVAVENGQCSKLF